MDNDITLKDIEILVGNLKAIHKKLSDKDSGAIVKLENILNKIDPVVINISAKREKQELQDAIEKIEILIKTMQSEIESISAKYYEDSKDLAQTLIGKSLKEVLNIIENEKLKAIESIKPIDIDKRLNLNYLILSSSIIVSVALGYLMGSM